MLVLPENYVPLEWLMPLARKAASEHLAVITGIEHVFVGRKVYNLTAVILPYKLFDTVPTAAIIFQLKTNYSPEETHQIEGHGFDVVSGEDNTRPLYRWNDCYFPVYCCFELASIKARAGYMSWADMIVAIEHNKDTNYFSSIVESLTRDMHCYCVQVNSSEYGDSRITQPTSSVLRNLLSVKGGLNHTILTGDIDIKGLREFQIKDYSLQKDGVFKPTPPGYSVEIVRKKIKQAKSAK